MPMVGLIFLAVHFPGLVKPNFRRMPYFVLFFMAIEVARGVLDWVRFQSFGNNFQNDYFAFSKWRFLISGILPSIWTRIWFSRSVSAYFTEISKISYRRLSTSIAPKRMVLTVNLTVKILSPFCS